MRKMSLVAAVAMLTAIGAVAASAQEPVREGFYVSAGGAYGMAGLSGDQGTQLSDLSSALKEGFSGYLAFGGTLSSKFRLGVEGDAFWSSAMVASTTVSYSTMMYSAVLAAYPSEKSDFHAKLYLGYMVTAINQDIGQEAGFGWGVGVGYDWRVAKGGLVLIPFVNYLGQLSGAAFSLDTSPQPEKFKASLWQFGIGIGYRH